MDAAAARSRFHSGRAATLAERCAQGERALERAADSRALFGLPRVRRARSQIFQLLQRVDCRQIPLSWSVRSPGTTDRELHPLAAWYQPRAPMESSLSARAWIGCAAGRGVGRRSRAVMGARQ